MWDTIKHLAYLERIANNFTYFCICSSPLEESNVIDHHLNNGMLPLFGEFLKSPNLIIDGKEVNWYDLQQIDTVANSLQITFDEQFTKSKFHNSFAELIWLINYDWDISLLEYTDGSIDPETNSLLYYSI